MTVCDVLIMTEVCETVGPGFGKMGAPMIYTISIPHALHRQLTCLLSITNAYNYV